MFSPFGVGRGKLNKLIKSYKKIADISNELIKITLNLCDDSVHSFHHLFKKIYFQFYFLKLKKIDSENLVKECENRFKVFLNLCDESVHFFTTFSKKLMFVFTC